MADDAFNEDIFDDLYDEVEEPAKHVPAAPAVQAEPEPTVKSEPVADPSIASSNTFGGSATKDEYALEGGDAPMDGSAADGTTWNGSGDQGFKAEPAADDNYGPINVKEDG
ncbi:hypothetical protein N0V90_002703 [Kalmusia sp. IMI 367209]|nr:hypothetical protein N0V90_002703 [Kalmusia sp. IMI 367209]